MGQLVSEKVATLHELKTVYTLEDAHLMYEALYVKGQNEWLANERAMKKAELKAK